MAYIHDMDPRWFKQHPGRGKMVPIGWLDVSHRFRTGVAGAAVHALLKDFQASEWQPYSVPGWHECNLCLYDGPRSHKHLFIPGDGVTFVAPEGIVHYVGCHRYLPPKPFIDALLTCPAPDSRKYFAALHANGWAEWLARPYPPSAEELRSEAETQIVHAHGRAMCTAIDAFARLHDRLPVTLDEALALVPLPEWEYTAQPNGDYTLTTSWQRPDGERVRMKRHGRREMDEWFTWS